MLISDDYETILQIYKQESSDLQGGEDVSAIGDLNLCSSFRIAYYAKNLLCYNVIETDNKQFEFDSNILRGAYP